jgi:hypothetical protein
MKRALIFFCFLIACKCLNAQDAKSIDVRYIEAIQYFQKSDSIKKEIKRCLGKRSLKYEIYDTLVGSEAINFKYSKDFKKYGMPEKDLKVVDSLNRKKGIQPGLELFSTDTTSDYCLKFSPVCNDMLFAKFARKDFVKFSDGSILTGRGAEVWMLFLYKNNKIQKVFWDTMIFESSVVYLK